jgi:uncharacterized membrane protein YccC
MSIADIASSPPPPSPALRIRNEWADRLLGSDPGLNRLRMALQTVLSIAIALGAEALFVHFTNALQLQTHGARLPTAQAAKVASTNHVFLVVAMLLGAVVGLISSFGVHDSTAKGQLVTLLLIPVPVISAMALGIALGSDRTIALVALVLIVAFGTYCRRFGPRGSLAGPLLFIGDFFGFFLASAVTISDIGWLAAEIAVAIVVAIVVRFVFFFPRPSKALRRTQRSYDARARKVAALALELFDKPQQSERDAHRLRRQSVRLNEAALMIDAQLGDPSAVTEGSSAQLLHQRLFDVELALTNVARFVQAMGRLDLPADQRSEVRLALLDIVHQDTNGARTHAQKLLELLHGSGPDAAEDERSTVVIAHRFAGSVITLAQARSEWLALGSSEGEGDHTFEAAVALFGGWLPGSAEVSTAASLERGNRLFDRIRLPRYTRTAIQMGVAVGIAIVLGDLLSEKRFYWAVIAAFITFMGANNAGEQSRKALHRVAGTVVGIAVGSLLAQAVGHDTYSSLAVILIAMFFAAYLLRISYAFMVIGITVMVSQLYVHLGEFSNSLLLVRLEETAIGASVAIAVVTLVFPLRTSRVLSVALRDHVQALARLVDRATGCLLGRENDTETTLREDARALDASYQALIATAQPLRRHLDTRRLVRIASASRDYSRNLVTNVGAVGSLDTETSQEIANASETLHHSMDTVAEAINGARDGTYTRSAALFDRVGRRLDESTPALDARQLATRDLTLIDGAMARLAEAIGLHITDYDTMAIE